jgi:hypothetical protein
VSDDAKTARDRERWERHVALKRWLNEQPAADIVVPDADTDDGFQRLAAELPAAWALLPVDGDPFEVVGSFVRAAYGRGYSLGLEGRAA